MSMEGWWMVHTMVRPVLTMLRTALITMAAALASSPAQAQVRVFFCMLSYRGSVPSHHPKEAFNKTTVA